jgi:hypothetical protein
MKDDKENEASLLPGIMTERRLMELWAANKDVLVIYSLKNMGCVNCYYKRGFSRNRSLTLTAKAICSASERTVEMAPPATGRAMASPPKKVWSTTVALTPTAVDAMPRVSAKPSLVPILTAENVRELACDARSIPCLEYVSHIAIQHEGKC